MSPLLAGLLVTFCAGIAIRGVVLLRDRGPAEKALVLRKDDDGPRTGLFMRVVNVLAGRLGPRLWRAMSTRARTRMVRMPDRAGRPGGRDVESEVGRWAAYWALTLLGAALFTLLGAGAASLPLLILGLIGPYILLSRAARLRQERLARDLPDFLDVLSVTVRAGLSYRAALERVADALGGPVGEEITTTLRQMDLGASRRTAFLALRERNSCDALSSFVTAQLQAEELGVPLADTLNDITLDVRRSSHQDARRRAQRAAPRVSLVVTTVLLPASILMIMVGLFLGADLDFSQLS